MKTHMVMGFAALIVLAACSVERLHEPAADNREETGNDARPTASSREYTTDRNVYFGDLHIHTAASFDAYIFNVRRTPDDAYRFAKGEVIDHPLGYDMQISGGPLDFYAVTDHAEYLGIFPAMDSEGHPLSELPQADELFSDDLNRIAAAYRQIGASLLRGKPVEELNDTETMASAWAANIAAAEKHYVPGEFTTFAAYEYTSLKVKLLRLKRSFRAGNLHRNVIFADAAPDRIFSSFDSQNPEDLWDWMDDQRSVGIDAVSIPHNSNVSDGHMFRTETFSGKEMDNPYAEQRMRNEPLVEVTQVKGTSETHPSLSPNDEWSNFEIFDRLLATSTQSKIKGGYVRDAYGTGLELQEEKGFNPYRFGLVGGSDTHVVAGGYSEDNYWSKIGAVDGSPELRGTIPPAGQRDWEGFQTPDETSEPTSWYHKWGASGLSGVWAEENTRESIFAAFRRKETFATTGTRMKVRFFAGFGFGEGLLNDPELVKTAYTTGVSMGGDLLGTGEVPSFIVWAQRDPNASALQRAQIVKVTSSGEQVFDVVCHTGEPDPMSHRCPDNGARVNEETCSIIGDGAAELKTLWQDPTFSAGENAAYYVRVLENPTCRWSTWDAIRNGTPPRPDTPATIQERAYTSPIWYAAVE